MKKGADVTYAANLALYEALVAANPNVDRKGATMPYTQFKASSWKRHFLGESCEFDPFT